MKQVEYISQTVLLLSDIDSSKTYKSVSLVADTPRDGELALMWCRNLPLYGVHVLIFII